MNCRVTLADMGLRRSPEYPIPSSVQVLLLVGSDGAVGGGVSHTRQHKAVGDLVVVQEGLVGLVHISGIQLARAGGAGARTAGVGQVNAGLLLGGWGWRGVTGAREGTV